MPSHFISHVGAVRKNNEDAVYCDDRAGVYAVADGIGGSQAGEVASAIVVQVLADKLGNQLDGEPLILLKEAYYEANDILYNAGKQRALDGMGTTMTTAMVRDDKIYLVHVGDSRAYLLNKKAIRQLTTDHTLVNELVKDGSITQAEAERHPRRNVITRSLGADLLVEVDERVVAWEIGDYLLLCSDGLYSLVEDKEIQEITLNSVDLKSALELMVKIAIDRGGYDNISAIIVPHQ